MNTKLYGENEIKAVCPLLLVIIHDDVWYRLVVYVIF